MRTVIFDLDGTLADTSADLIAAANACFRAAGHGDLLDPVRDAATAFLGGRAMLRMGYARLGAATPEDRLEEDYLSLIAHYGENISRHTTLYPGAEAALAALLGEGYRLGICTNKPLALAEELLARLGVRGMFGAVIGADSLPVRKPDPAPYIAAVEATGGTLARSLMIGDTVIDHDTARAAGVPVILVSFGPEGSGVLELSPDARLDDYADLPALAARFLGA